MSKYGIIYCAFNTEEYVERSLAPWIAARRDKLGGHEFVICAVSVPFEGFQSDGFRDKTRSLIGAHSMSGDIDHAIVSDHAMKETEARGQALKWLMTQGCDASWMVDSDEFYVADEIAHILSFVESRPHVEMFKIALKNQVFTPSQYLVEPFTPPRIHRINAGTYVAHSFWGDNNVLYRGTLTRDFRRDIDLTNITVPKSIAWVRHASWLNNVRSKAKVAYQATRWGAETCTFAWDDSRGGLIFNPALPEPEIAREDQ